MLNIFSKCTLMVIVVVVSVGGRTMAQVNDDDDGQYHPERYAGADGEDGRYVHDNSGQYVPDYTGLYKGDRSGTYRSEGGSGGGIRANRFNQHFPIRKQPSNFLLEQSNQLRDDNHLGTTNRDQFSSSTFAPVSKILHRKPLEGIQDVEFIPLRKHNKKPFFTNDEGESDTRTTHSALRTTFPPPNYSNQGRQGRDDGRWRILKQNSDVAIDGYQWNYETENGIQAEESGKVANKGSDLEAMRAQGFFRYTGPDNKVYSVTYTADENGFVAQGNHLPTPPPIPPEILESLKYQQQPSSGRRGQF